MFLVLAGLVALLLGRFGLRWVFVLVCVPFPSISYVSFSSTMTWALRPHGVRTRGKKKLAWLLQPLTPSASVITADLHPGPFCRKSLYPVCHSLVWLVRLYLDNRKWPPLTGRIEMRFHTQIHLTFS